MTVTGLIFRPLSSRETSFRAIGDTITSGRHNLDGFVVFGGQSGNAPGYESYIQVFRSGVIEAVNSSILEGNATMKLIPSTHYEQEIEASLTSIQRFLQKLNVELHHGTLAGLDRREGAHAMLPLDAPLSGAFGVLLTMLAHTVGWPVVKGGSAGITDALVSELESLGATIQTGRLVECLDDLPRARVVLLDVSPDQLLVLGSRRLPMRTRRAVERFTYGPGVCKVDWALSGAVPWSAPGCENAGTVHVGGTFEEIAASESDVAWGRHPERPFCLVVQPSVVDPSRAPGNGQTLWGYCHVPRGSDVDMTDAIESQIERYAPGFREFDPGPVDYDVSSDG